MNERPPDINPSSPGNKTRRVSTSTHKINAEVLPNFLDLYNKVIAEQTLICKKSARSVLPPDTSTKSLNIINSSSNNKFMSSIVPPKITKKIQPSNLSHISKIANKARLTQPAKLTQSTSSGDSLASYELLEAKEKTKYSNIRENNEGYAMRSTFSSTPIADKYTGSAQFTEPFYSILPKKTRSASGEKFFFSNHKIC
jgi:hypothetical protein